MRASAPAGGGSGSGSVRRLALSDSYTGPAARVSRFDGSRWSALTAIPDVGWVADISCVSSVFCLATSGAGAQIYDGTSWSSPASTGLSDPAYVSCSSSTFCLADDFHGMASAFNGHTWSYPVRADVYGGDTSSVSCVSASCCAATSYGGTLSTFDGMAWKSPAFADTTHLVSVSCPSSLLCVAVDAVPYEPQSSILEYTGVSPTQRIDPIADTSLGDVSCPTSTFCVAVAEDGRIVFGR